MLTTLTSVALAAAEETGHAAAEPAIHPYVVGALALGGLLILLAGLLVFGKGREHC